MNAQAYQRITERIIALLEQGTVPWHKPWKASTGLPRNLVTKRDYRGINVFLLLVMGYESPFWLSLRQVNQLGGTVRKGEKACPVVFWKKLAVEDRETGEPKTIPLLRYYHVFNIAQCEGVERSIPAPADAAQDALPPALRAEEIVDGMPQRPQIKYGFAKAFYSPREDFVGLPPPDRFEREADYYTTLFHELVHATGHETRLNRPTLTETAGFGSDPYCKEELIAEMGAAFLCGQAEIVERTIDNSAAYLQAWLARLKTDRTLVVHAAAQAQKAADFILGKRESDAQITEKGAAS